MCLVDLATGRLSLVEKDFALDGLIPLRLERSYRSTNIWRSDLGFGWSHNFGVRLWPQEDGTQLVVRGADGRRVIVPFPEKDKPAEALAEGVMIQIVPARQIPWPQLKSAAAEGLLVVQAAGFPSMLFEARRLRELYPLRGLADRSGNLVHITPTNQGLPARADDPHGRSIVFWRDDHGRLEQISLQPSPKAERISLVRYQYDQRGDLSAVHDAAGVRHYEYDSAHRLTSHRDRTGAACLTTYDAQGRCIRSGQPGGTQQRTYSYDPEHFQTTVTDSLGHSRVYEFNKDERVVRTVDSDGGESKFDYDVENRLVCVTNQAGGQTVICFDAQGAPAGKVAPDGSASGIITDDKGQIIHEISCAGASNGYKRDELGRVVEAIRAGRGTVKIA